MPGLNSDSAPAQGGGLLQGVNPGGRPQTPRDMEGTIQGALWGRVLMREKEGEHLGESPGQVGGRGLIKEVNVSGNGNLVSNCGGYIKEEN